MNTARKIEYYEELPMAYDQKIIIRKKPNIKLKRRRALFKALLSLILIGIGFCTFIVLSNYQKITALNIELNHIDAIMVEAEKTETALVGKLEELKSERDIIFEATTKLGMTFPENDQIVYFQLNEDEKNIIVKNDTNMLSRVYSIILGKAE